MHYVISCLLLESNHNYREDPITVQVCTTIVKKKLYYGKAINTAIIDIYSISISFNEVLHKGKMWLD